MSLVKQLFTVIGGEALAIWRRFVQRDRETKNEHRECSVDDMRLKQGGYRSGNGDARGGSTTPNRCYQGHRMDVVRDSLVCDFLVR